MEEEVNGGSSGSGASGPVERQAHTFVTQEGETKDANYIITAYYSDPEKYARHPVTQFYYAETLPEAKEISSILVQAAQTMKRTGYRISIIEALLDLEIYREDIE